MKRYRYHTYWAGHGWLDKVPDDWQVLEYGDFDLDPNGKFVEVPCTTYSGYSGGTVERANCDKFLEMFGDLPGVYEVTGGYGTRGVFIRRACLRCDEIREVIEGLDDYPLIDDESLSDLEMQLEDEAWDVWIKYDLERELDKHELPTEGMEDRFWEIVRNHEIYFSHEDAISPYIDLDEVLKYWEVQ